MNMTIEDFKKEFKETEISVAVAWTVSNGLFALNNEDLDEIPAAALELYGVNFKDCLKAFKNLPFSDQRKFIKRYL